MALALVAAACGSSVTTPGSSSGGGTAGGGTGAGDTTTGAGGATTSSSSSSGFSSSSSSSSSGGFEACTGTLVTVATPDSTLNLPSVCGWGSFSTKGPVAYFFLGGGAAVGELQIEGCQAEGEAPALTLALDTMGSEAPGTFTVGTAQLTPGLAEPMLQGPPTVTITKFGKLGDTVEGSYEAVVDGNGGAVAIKGDFRVCRVDDLAAP